MFVNKYKDTVFDLPDTGNKTFYVGKNEIAWVRGRDCGWTILETMMLNELKMTNLPLF